jgi:hypothetical protein
VLDRPYDEETFVNIGLVDSKSYKSYKVKTSNDVYSFRFALLPIIFGEEANGLLEILKKKKMIVFLRQ